MAFNKKLKIENATAFKLEYYIGYSELKKKQFKTYKVMEQFHNRQKDFLYVDCNRYAKINGKWHLFIKLSSPFVFDKELDFINRSFTKIEAENLQNK